MHQTTRQEQAQAILQRRGQAMASRILDRRANSAADFDEAFNLERIDLISEIPTPEAMLALGRNTAGPSDDLYIHDDGGSYRVYIQEKGEVYYLAAGLSFEAARDEVIDRLIQLQGLPFTPPG